jgi:hypothetical protein
MVIFKTEYYSLNTTLNITLVCLAQDGKPIWILDLKMQ